MGKAWCWSDWHLIVKMMMVVMLMVMMVLV